MYEPFRTIMISFRFKRGFHLNVRSKGGEIILNPKLEIGNWKQWPREENPLSEGAFVSRSAQMKSFSIIYTPSLSTRNRPSRNGKRLRNMLKAYIKKVGSV